MIRVIVRTCNAEMAAHVGGDVATEFRTFDLDAPALESFLRETVQYGHRGAIGVECLPDTAGEKS